MSSPDDAADDAAGDELLGPPRDVPPPRPVRRPRRSRPLRPDVVGEIRSGYDEPAEDEPDWKRELREEAEFRAQFGAWQDPAPPPRVGPALVGLLLVIGVLLVLGYLVVG